MKRVIFYCLPLLFVFYNCEKKSKEDFDYGKIENGVYTNTYFDLTMPVPSNWVVQNNEQVENLKKLGSEALTGENENMKALIKASEVNTAYLLTLFRYEQGAPVPFNPSFIMIAENIKQYPGIKSGKDYLYTLKKSLVQSQMKYEIDEKIDQKVMSGKTYDILSAQLNTGVATIYQQYITTKLDNFELSFIATYATEAEKDTLYQFMNSVRFK